MTAIHETNGTSTATLNGDAKRDEQGRFGKGNRGGPGNPFARQTAKLRQAALDAVDDKDIRDVINALKEKAKQGDTAAAKLLLSYSVGKPTTAANPDTLDQEELQMHINNHATTPEGIVAIVKGLPLDLLLGIIRAILPILAASKVKQAAAIFSASQDTDNPSDEEEEEQDDLVAPSPNVVAEQFPGADDMIPDWLREIASSECELSTQNAPRHEVPATSFLPAEGVKELISDLLDRVEKHIANDNRQPKEQTVQSDQSDRLADLLERIDTRIVQSKSPTPNGSNRQDEGSPPQSPPRAG